jgi:hypothetical protein
MSYDLRLFPPKEGEDPQRTIEKMIQIEEEELCGIEEPEGDTGSVALSESSLQLADDLSATFTGFDRFEDEDHIELSWERHGLQVSLFPDSVAVTVPYWEQPPAFAGEVERVVSYITQKTGYLIYDPQTERVMEELDVPSMVATIQQIHGQLREELAPKKWWQFWR